MNDLVALFKACRDDPDYRDRMRKKLMEIHRDAIRLRECDIISTDLLTRNDCFVRIYMTYSDFKAICKASNWCITHHPVTRRIEAFTGPFMLKAVYQVGCEYAVFYSQG